MFFTLTRALELVMIFQHQGQLLKRTLRKKPLIHSVLKQRQSLYLGPKTKSTDHHSSGYSHSTLDREKYLNGIILECGFTIHSSASGHVQSFIIYLFEMI